MTQVVRDRIACDVGPIDPTILVMYTNILISWVSEGGIKMYYTILSDTEGYHNVILLS